jgi:hypothetical protein
VSHEEVLEVQETFAVEWLELAQLASTQSVGGLRDKETQMITQRLVDVLDARLLEGGTQGDDEAMEIDDYREQRREELAQRIDKALFDMMVRIIRHSSTSDPCEPRSELRQLFTRFIASEASALVQVLFDDKRSPPLRACALLLLSHPLSTPSPAPPTATSPLTNSSTSPLEILSLSSLRQLDQNLQKNAECPFDLNSLRTASLLRSAYSLLQLDYDNRTSIRTERTAALEAQNSNTTEVARKRRKLEGGLAPSSDGLMEVDAEVPGSTARRRERKIGHTKDAASKLLNEMVGRSARRGDTGLKEALERGEKFEPFDSKIVRLIL